MPPDGALTPQPTPRKVPPHPLDVIRRARDQHGIRQVIVGVSGGKDASACLDLCCEHFGPGNVAAYSMALVPGLSFQERYLAYLDRRYSLKIIRLPHFGLSQLLRTGTFRYLRTKSLAAPNLKPRHIDAHVRKMTGLTWIANGEKAQDSVERNAMIRRVDGIDPKRRRLFPLAFWTHSTVYNHLKRRGIALSPEYSQTQNFQNMRSFGSLWFRDVAWIEQRFPEDFEKIVQLFPMLPGQILRYRERARRESEKTDGQEKNSPA